MAVARSRPVLPDPRPIPPDSARSRPILHALHDGKLVTRTLETKKIRQKHPPLVVHIHFWVVIFGNLCVLGVLLFESWLD